MVIHIEIIRKKQGESEKSQFVFCYYVTRLFVTKSDRQSPEVWGPGNSTRILGSLCASFRNDKDVLYTARALAEAGPKDFTIGDPGITGAQFCCNVVPVDVIVIAFRNKY